MDTKKLFESEAFQRSVIGVGIALAVLVVFQAGVFVGFHKAGFSYRMGDNYYRAFGVAQGPFPHEFVADFPNAHGAIGKIVSVQLPTFVIEEENHSEKVILLTGNTAIRRLKGVATTSDIVPGEFAVVIGAPNDNAEVEAALVRLLPPPSTFDIPVNQQ